MSHDHGQSPWLFELLRQGYAGGKAFSTPEMAQHPSEARTCWPDLLRIDIEQCARCGGRVRIIASIEDPALIGRILTHREQARGGAAEAAAAAHRPRGPPGQGRLDLN